MEGDMPLFEIECNETIHASSTYIVEGDSSVQAKDAVKNQRTDRIVEKTKTFELTIDVNKITMVKKLEKNA
jgi:hypothetical protein